VDATTLRRRRAVEILLSCAGARLKTEPVGRLRSLLQDGVPWPELVQVAGVQGMLSLLSWQLRETCPDLLPEPWSTRLRDAFHANAHRNLRLTHDLTLVLGALEHAAVEAVAWKGPLLAATAYGNLALRDFSDLDILVRRHDLDAASSVLVGLGYERANYIPRQRERQFLRAENEVIFAREGLLIDLHWRLASPRYALRLEPEDLWLRLRPAELAGVAVRTFAPEDLLLALCFHGAQHSWERLSWICDLAELLRAGGAPDWAIVRSRARALGIERTTRLGLSLTRSLLGAGLDPVIISWIGEDRSVAGLRRQVRSALDRAAPQPIESPYRSSFYVRTRERWRDRVSFVAGTLMTPTEADWRGTQLPPWLSAAQIVWHPARVAARHGLPFLRQMFTLRR